MHRARLARSLPPRSNQEAIRTLNVLLRFDADAYEGYFLRGIAKYNLDDLLGADNDFSIAIEKNPVFTDALNTITTILNAKYKNWFIEFK